MLIVVEPTKRSLGTAEQIKSLAEDILLKNLYIVGSKVQGKEDEAFIEENSPGLPVIGHLPDDPRVRQADREGTALFDLSPEMAKATQAIVQALEADRE
jgi:CO dehydrogenase maturation factor